MEFVLHVRSLRPKINNIFLPESDKPLTMIGPPKVTIIPYRLTYSEAARVAPLWRVATIFDSIIGSRPLYSMVWA